MTPPDSRSGSQPVPRGPGNRPAVPMRCRQALRSVEIAVPASTAGAGGPAFAAPAETRQHLADCAFCSARVAASVRLATVLADRSRIVRAPVPTSALLDGIYERIVEQAEATPIARTVAQAIAAVPSPAAADDAGGVAGEASSQPGGAAIPAAAAEVPASLLTSDLAQALLTAPEPLSALTWSRIRRSVLEQVAASASRRRRWPLAVAGAAAALLMGVLALTGGSERAPTIVFTDLEGPPNIDFTVLRYGVRR